MLHTPEGAERLHAAATDPSRHAAPMHRVVLERRRSNRLLSAWKTARGELSFPSFAALEAAASSLEDVRGRIKDPAVLEKLRGTERDPARVKLAYKLSETDKLALIPACIEDTSQTFRNRGAVEDLWDSIAADQSLLPLTPEQRAELDRRLDAYESDGNAGRPAEDVIADIRKRL